MRSAFRLSSTSKPFARDEMSENQPHKVHLVSLGCPKNTVDSERMLGLLQGLCLSDDGTCRKKRTWWWSIPAALSSRPKKNPSPRLGRASAQARGAVRGSDRHRVSIDALLRGASAGVGGSRQLLTIADEADIVHHVTTCWASSGPGTWLACRGLR